jgi:hypothetical protein
LNLSNVLNQKILFEIIYISGLKLHMDKISSKRKISKNLENEMIFGDFIFAVK